jgi:hypothetical protein
VHYGTNEAAAKETISAIEAAGGQAFAIRAKLGVPGDAENCGRNSTHKQTGWTSWSTTPESSATKPKLRA